MPHDPQPQWQSIRALTTLALEQARSRPYILDNATVAHVIDVYTRQQADMPLYDEQLQRWKTSTITTAQRNEVERLQAQVQKLRTALAAVLTLADELKRVTIDTIMAKSDLEVGLEYLMRGGLGDDTSKS